MKPMRVKREAIDSAEIVGWCLAIAVVFVAVAVILGRA
jgi:hypothetical protein